MPDEFLLMIGDLVILAGVLAGFVVLLRHRDRLAGRAVALGATGLGAVAAACLLNVVLRVVWQHGRYDTDVALAGLLLRMGDADGPILTLFAVYCCWALGVVLLTAALVTTRPTPGPPPVR